MCRRVLPIHPNFRVVAVGEPEAKSRERSAAKSSWLNPEVLSMFHFHHVTPLPQEQEREVIMKKVGLHQTNTLLCTRTGTYAYCMCLCICMYTVYMYVQGAVI